MIGRVRALLGRLRLRDEAGFTILELMAALSILAISFFTLAASASAGLRLLAEGRQRQAATEVANARLEHLRNIPYANVALNETVSQSPDEDDPDFFVNAEGDAYDYEGAGTYEDLVFDLTDGQVAHLENPDVQIGGTLLGVYQYVTWVDDPAVTGSEDYKRLTVVVSYRAPVSRGRPRSVRVSALFTTGGVIIPGSATAPTEGSGSTPSPTPSPTPSGPCAGDDDAPAGDFSILSGSGAEEGFSAGNTVTLSMAPSDSCLPITVRFSNDAATYGDPITYDADNPTATWTLTDGDGAKEVWATFEDGAGNLRALGPHGITVDATKPSTPSSLTRTIGCQGDDRTVSLSWGISTDTNFDGYRVYRSVNGAAYAALLTTATASASDTHKKTLDSVRYVVVGYDKAGNESESSNEISLSKNQCS